MAASDESKSDKASDIEFLVDTLKWMDSLLGESFVTLMDEDDWTYVIKLHAMIETALNDALIKQFDAPDLSKIIAKLDTSNTATGKVAFAKALKILNPRLIVFIQKLSELRNFCVHDIRNFKFDIEGHLASLNEEKRNEIVKPLLKIVQPETRDKIPVRGALFSGTIQVMFELYAHHMKCEIRLLESKRHQLQSQLYERYQSSSTKE